MIADELPKFAENIFEFESHNWTAFPQLQCVEHDNAAANGADLHPAHSPNPAICQLKLNARLAPTDLPIDDKPRDRMTLHHPNNPDYSKRVQHHPLTVLR